MTELPEDVIAKMCSVFNATMLAEFEPSSNWATLHRKAMRAALSVLDSESGWRIVKSDEVFDIRTFASGLKKFAPDLAQQLSERWIKANKETDEALKRFVDFMNE